MMLKSMIKNGTEKKMNAKYEQKRQGGTKDNIQNRRNEKQKIVSKQRQDEKDRQNKYGELDKEDNILSKALGEDKFGIEYDEEGNLIEENEKEIEFKQLRPCLHRIRE